MTRLHTLVLSSNDISQLDGDIFRPLSSLKILRLSNNPLHVIRRDTFKYLTDLQELRLDSCLLNRIEPGAFRPFIAGIEIFSVAYNQLSVFNADLVPFAFQRRTSQNRLALKEMHLYGNPWHCNCQMKYLRQLLADSPDIAFNFGDLKSPHCFSPPHVSGQLWSRVPVDRFGCEPVVTGANMPAVPKVGQNVTLQCSFAADPSPSFRWFKDGIPVPDLEQSNGAMHGKFRQLDRKVATHNFTSRLDLIEVTGSFAGLYECVAENTAGSSKSKFQLRIRANDGSFYDIAQLPDVDLSTGLLASFVNDDPKRSPTIRLLLVAGVIGAVLIIFLLTATAVYLCFCKKKIGKEGSAVEILRKIEAKRLAMNVGQESTLRKAILSNSSSINSQLRRSQMLDGDEVKLNDVYPSHLSSTSPSSSQESSNDERKRGSSNSTVVTNDRSSTKSSPDNSCLNSRLGADRLLRDEIDEAMEVVAPLCNNNPTDEKQSEMAMVHSAAFKTYSEYLSLTLPKMVHSPRFTTKVGDGQEKHSNALLQATLTRQLPPILSAYGYVQQGEHHQQVKKSTLRHIHNESDGDFSDAESSSLVGTGRLSSSYHHGTGTGGRRHQRINGDLHHSVFLPTPLSFGNNTGSATIVNNNKTNNTINHHEDATTNHIIKNNNNLVHFLNEPTHHLMQSAASNSSGDTSV